MIIGSLFLSPTPHLHTRRTKKRVLNSNQGMINDDKFDVLNAGSAAARDGVEVPSRNSTSWHRNQGGFEYDYYRIGTFSNPLLFPMREREDPKQSKSRDDGRRGDGMLWEHSDLSRCGPSQRERVSEG